MVKVQAIVAFFADEPKLVGRGQNVLDSNQITNFVHNRDSPFLRATVEASMKDKIYDVKIELNSEGEVASATCQCRRGNIRCHHMAAALLYANRKMPTEACSRPSNHNKSLVKSNPAIPIDTSFLPTKSFVALKRPFTNADAENFRKKLRSFSSTIGFSWLLSEEPDPLTMLRLPKVEDIIFSRDFADARDGCAFLCDKLQLTWDEVVTVAELTRGMGSNSLANLVTKGRVSTSNFGAIIAAKESQKYPPSLLKNILGSYTLESVREEQWQRQKMENAVRVFEDHTGLRVVPTGVWLHASGLFCATPDGFVEDDGIVEVKCPLRFKDLDKSLLEVFQKEKDNILIQAEDTTLNTEHPYYHQAQGKLYLTNRKTCYFIIWSPNDVIITKIERNEEWKAYFETLTQFYKNVFFHILLDRNKFF